MILFISKNYLSLVDVKPDERKICYDKHLDIQEN